MRQRPIRQGYLSPRQGRFPHFADVFQGRLRNLAVCLCGLATILSVAVVPTEAASVRGCVRGGPAGAMEYLFVVAKDGRPIANIRLDDRRCYQVFLPSGTYAVKVEKNGRIWKGTLRSEDVPAVYDIRIREDK